ncbi:MAG TPA: glycosyl hydrolase 53 family protein, partial [Tepidisphaeraceae bacterium]|nr:glycosyl hydrolase 53 family protein [Tepidisphaeraceae bacterium]
MHTGRCVFGAVAICLLSAAVASADPDPFYMGTDISLLGYMQQQGMVFKNNGVPQPADQILYDAGDNLFRLRLFVNPNTNYSVTGGAIQTQAYDIALAQQIKANDPDAKFLLD